MIKNGRPEPGFEPGTEDPQSHMLPGYTIRAIYSKEPCSLGDSIDLNCDLHEVFLSFSPKT